MSTIVKVVVLSFIILFFIFNNSSHGEKQIIYVRGIQCNFSEKYIYPNMSCYPKSYNRSFSTANLFVTFKKPLRDIFVSRYDAGMIKLVVPFNFLLILDICSALLQIWHNLPRSSPQCKFQLVSNHGRSNR